MKFGHDFKETLAGQDFPPHWVDHAIPYSQLKKCLKKVTRELQDLGLDPETLRDLLDPNTTSPVALQYKLDAASDSKLLRPRLTVYVHLQDGVAVDASLTPTSREFFKKIATGLNVERQQPALNAPIQRDTVASPSDSDAEIEDVVDRQLEQQTELQSQLQSDLLSESQTHESLQTTPAPESQSQLALASQTVYETIEIPLVFDAEFFDILQSDVNNLDALQAQEEKKMTEEIVALGKEVALVAKPTRFSKSDLARWRHIFELYLDAEIFFATHEQDHGARSSQMALKQLKWFQNQVETRQLSKDFKLNESRLAFTRFLNLNRTLLKNLQFQELNKLAVAKILKKFDKRTALGISKAFPTAVHSDKLLAGSIAQDVCAQMSRELVSVVPQLNDYLCPIQRRKEKHCPLCRADVVMNASVDNLDQKLEKYLRKYFSKEVKEKQRSNEIERGLEDYGPGYTHQDCTVM
ncbi:Fc.00g013100.m01.CDS01 [Cosmosporella sp. VM-42]